MTAFTLVIYEHPQVNITLPLALGAKTAAQFAISPKVVSQPGVA